MFEQAGWDLDRASEAGFGMKADADLEVLRWSIVHRQEKRARDAVHVLLENPRAGGRTETIKRLVDQAAEVWGPRRLRLCWRELTALSGTVSPVVKKWHSQELECSVKRGDGRRLLGFKQRMWHRV